MFFITLAILLSFLLGRWSRGRGVPASTGTETMELPVEQHPTASTPMASTSTTTPEVFFTADIEPALLTIHIEPPLLTAEPVEINY